MRVNFVFSILFLFTFNATAQTNYKPGRISNLQGEIIEGYITYQFNRQSPKQIYFKKSLEATPKLYQPKDLKGFSVEESYYTSAIVEVEESSRLLKSLDSDKKLNITIDTVFLETVIEGKTGNGLYLYTGKNINFYISKDENYELLQYKEYFKNNETSTTEFKGYIWQLLTYLEDCEDIRLELNKTTYRSKSLKKLFKHYYDCTDKELDFEKKPTKKTFNVGLVVGANFTSLDMKSDEYGYRNIDGAEFNNSILPTFGISYKFAFPFNKKRWFLYTDILFTRYSVQANYEEVKTNEFYRVTDIELELSYLKLNALLQYQIKSSPFNVGIGVSNARRLNEVTNKYYYRDISQPETVTFVNGKLIDNLSGYEFGLLCSISAQIGNFNIEGRYEKTKGVSDISTISSPTHRTYFLVKYIL